MKAMKITTETGSVYDIGDHGICRKTDSEGNHVDSFKPLYMVPITKETTTLGEIHELPQGEPVIGKRLYISGLNNWWLTTRIVSVKY